MEMNLVAEAVKFMILGMSIVFSFLYILMLFINFQAKIVAKFFPDVIVAETTQTKQPSQEQKNKVVAAITAAINHHKNNS